MFLSVCMMVQGTCPPLALTTTSMLPNLSYLFGTDTNLNLLLKKLAQAEPQQEAEFINLFYGEDVSDEEAVNTLELFRAACPDAEVTLLPGGQPVYYYMVSAE